MINISDHFKKVHSSIFADTEQYARLRKGLTRLLPDGFPVMSVRKVSATQENASTGSDEPCDLATNNADSASLEMRKSLVHNDIEETLQMILAQTSQNMKVVLKQRMSLSMRLMKLMVLQVLC